MLGEPSSNWRHLLNRDSSSKQYHRRTPGTRRQCDGIIVNLIYSPAGFSRQVSRRSVTMKESQHENVTVCQRVLLCHSIEGNAI